MASISLTAVTGICLEVLLLLARIWLKRRHASICCHMLLYGGVWKHMLAYAHEHASICQHMQAYAGILEYASIF